MNFCPGFWCSPALETDPQNLVELWTKTHAWFFAKQILWVTVLAWSLYYELKRKLLRFHFYFLSSMVAHKTPKRFWSAPLEIAWEIKLEWFGSTRPPDGLEPETAQWSPRNCHLTRTPGFFKIGQKLLHIFIEQKFCNGFAVCLHSIFRLFFRFFQIPLAITRQPNNFIWNV